MKSEVKGLGSTPKLIGKGEFNLLDYLKK